MKLIDRRAIKAQSKSDFKSDRWFYILLMLIPSIISLVSFFLSANFKMDTVESESITKAEISINLSSAYFGFTLLASVILVILSFLIIVGIHRKKEDSTISVGKSIKMPENGGVAILKYIVAEILSVLIIYCAIVVPLLIFSLIRLPLVGAIIGFVLAVYVATAMQMILYISVFRLMEKKKVSMIELIRLSFKYTKGHIIDIIVFDLSFIGWYILSVITLGILNIFFVAPYYTLSKYNLFRTIYDEKDTDFTAKEYSEEPEFKEEEIASL